LLFKIPSQDFFSPTGCFSDGLPLLYREIATDLFANPALMDSVLTIPRNPMEYLFHTFLVSYREIGTHVIVSHFSHESPIPDLRYHLSFVLSPGPHAFQINREIVFREFAISVAPIHRTFQVPNSNMRCHLSSSHNETQSSDTYTPLGAFNPVGKSRIAISTHPVLSTPEKPKCRTPIQMDPWTRVLLINGSDCFGKSLIAIPFSKGLMSPETLMSRIPMNPWLLHCTLWLKPCATSFRSDSCRSFASSSHESQLLISFPLEIFVSRTLRHDPQRVVKFCPSCAFNSNPSEEFRTHSLCSVLQQLSKC
jgi:hypothetical protein